MQRTAQDWFSFLTLFALIYWAQSWLSYLGLDGMTYAALAKNILLTNDWLTLHYSPQFYPEFYQHPPLVIWLTAITFKVFGMSDLSSKILPSCFALGCFITIYRYCETHRPGSGLLACLVLISSTRFVKYTSTLMLDGPFTFFLILAVLALESRPTSTAWHTVTLSLGTVGALLSKGVPALLTLPLALICLFRHPEKRRLILLSTLIIFILVGIYVIFGNGIYFIQRYWLESVHSRLRAQSLEGHFSFAKNLIQTYWPWLPFALYALCKSLYHKRRLLIATAILGCFAGFSITGHYLEQYSTPIFPLCAILIALECKLPISAQWVKSFCLVYALVFALFPLQIQRVPGDTKTRELLMAFEQLETSRKHLVFLGNTHDPWSRVAVGTWYTSHPTYVFETEEQSRRNLGHGSVCFVNEVATSLTCDNREGSPEAVISLDQLRQSGTLAQLWRKEYE